MERQKASSVAEPEVIVVIDTVTLGCTRLTLLPTSQHSFCTLSFRLRTERLKGHKSCIATQTRKNNKYVKMCNAFTHCLV